jgi:hypothetical protein
MASHLVATAWQRTARRGGSTVSARNPPSARSRSSRSSTSRRASSRSSGSRRSSSGAREGGERGGEHAASGGELVASGLAGPAGLPDQPGARLGRACGRGRRRFGSSAPRGTGPDPGRTSFADSRAAGQQRAAGFGDRTDRRPCRSGRARAGWRRPLRRRLRRPAGRAVRRSSAPIPSGTGTWRSSATTRSGLGSGSSAASTSATSPSSAARSNSASASVAPRPSSPAGAVERDQQHLDDAAVRRSAGLQGRLGFQRGTDDRSGASGADRLVGQRPAGREQRAASSSPPATPSREAEQIDRARGGAR